MSRLTRIRCKGQGTLASQARYQLGGGFNPRTTGYVTINVRVQHVCVLRCEASEWQLSSGQDQTAGGN